MLALDPDPITNRFWLAIFSVPFLFLARAAWFGDWGTRGEIVVMILAWLVCCALLGALLEWFWPRRG